MDARKDGRTRGRHERGVGGGETPRVYFRFLSAIPEQSGENPLCNINMYTMLFSVVDVYLTMQQSNITDFSERIILKVYYYNNTSNNLFMVV